MSRITVVLGAQWGDEGKGKIVDRLAEDHSAVVRWGGGANAGHTIDVGGEKTVLHLMPSSCTRAGTAALIGPGVVCDPEVLEREIPVARFRGCRIMLDRGAPVVLPVHKMIDGLREASAGASGIGTTKRGIGPCYEDLVSRRGPKLGDLTSDDRFRRALTERGWFEERAAVIRHLGGTPPDLGSVVAWGELFRNIITPYLGDVRAEIARIRSEGREHVLLEGAQGVLLDVLHGSRPFCTSSYCTAGGAAAALGVYGFGRVIGAAKAYLTRVGSGPFPTELDDETGRKLRQNGHEFGATTGRPRRCGWLDLVALRYGARVGGIRELCVTKLDVLSGVDPVRLCVGYRFEGRMLGPEETLTNRVMREAAPVYEDFPGWTEDIRSVRRIADLPDAARLYLAEIKRFTGVPVTMVGVGPGRDQLAT